MNPKVRHWLERDSNVGDEKHRLPVDLICFGTLASSGLYNRSAITEVSKSGRKKRKEQRQTNVTTEKRSKCSFCVTSSTLQAIIAQLNRKLSHFRETISAAPTMHFILVSTIHGGREYPLSVLSAMKHMLTRGAKTLWRGGESI